MKKAYISPDICCVFIAAESILNQTSIPANSDEPATPGTNAGLAKGAYDDFEDDEFEDKDF